MRGLPPNIDEAVAVLRDAVAPGVNHIDTSDFYGPTVCSLSGRVDKAMAVLYRCSIKMAELLKGTLDLLILRTLNLGPNHGLGIARRIGQVTRGELDVKPGSLFPALYRLEERGWLTSMPAAGGTHPRAKLYKLTQAGRKQITTETASWCRIAEAMARVIEKTS